MATTTAPTTTDAPVTIAGLRLANYREDAAATQETTAFTATVLTAAGKKLGILTNTGHGGAHTFHYESRAAEREWILAVAEYGTDNPPAYDYPGASEQDLAEALAMTAFYARLMASVAPRGRMVIALDDLRDSGKWATTIAVPGPQRPAVAARVAEARPGTARIFYTVPRQSWPHVVTVAGA